MRQVLFIVMLFAVALSPSFVMAYQGVYDDFSGSSLNSSKWFISNASNPYVQGPPDEYWVDAFLQNYHTKQNSQKEVEVIVTATRKFYPGESLEFDAAKNPSSGNHMGMVFIDYDEFKWPGDKPGYICGFWDGDRGAGNQEGNYHAIIDFKEGYAVFNAEGPNGSFSQQNITGITMPYEFSFASRTGGNGMMHFDYDNFTITYDEVTINLASGWNLISIPLEPVNASIEFILQDIMQDVIVVNSFEDGALTYDPLLPQFSDLHYMDHLHGYWIKMNQSAGLAIAGLGPGAAFIGMNEGWNLISYLCGESMNVTLALARIMDNLTVASGFDGGALTYDPGAPEFSTLQELRPGFGYWVKVNQSAGLNYETLCNARTTGPAKYVPGQVLVKFRQIPGYNFTDELPMPTGIPGIDSLNAFYGVYRIERAISTPVDNDIYNLSLIYTFSMPPEADAEQAAIEYSYNPYVESAELNYIYYIEATPNDPRYGSQWAVNNRMRAKEAWDIERGNESVVIAILDTGVDWNHPDLAAKIWSNAGETAGNGIDDDANGYVDDVRGWDFIDDYWSVVWWGVGHMAGEDYNVTDNNPMDFNAHGTHCSGIAAAATNNSIGIAGACWNCRIMPVRIGFSYLDDKGNEQGAMTSTAILNGIVYATQNGADVISMSFGGYNAYSANTVNAIKDAFYNHSVVLVAAAGNDNKNDTHYPSSYQEIISVGATDSDDKRSVFGGGGASNWGNDVDVAAPGSSILSTVFDDTYDTYWGTSMATPYVAGMAGLLISQANRAGIHRGMTEIMFESEIRTRVLVSVDSINPDKYIGTGRINLSKAMEETRPYEWYTGDCFYITNDSTPTFNGRAVDTYNNIWRGDYYAFPVVNHTIFLDWPHPNGTVSPGDGSFNSKNETFTFTTIALPDGEYDIVPMMYNTRNNSALLYDQRMVLVDATAPAASITGESAAWVQSDAVSLNCSDGLAGCTCGNWYYFDADGVCSGSKQDYSGYAYGLPASITISSSHNDYLCLWVEDNAGNHGTDAGSQLKVDATAPVTTDDAPSAWSRMNVTVALTPADNLSGVNATYYCVDQANGCNPAAKGTSVVVGQEGINYVRYKSVDNVGNAESTHHVQVKIDKTNPATTDNAPGAWQKSDVSVTLACSDGSGSGCSATYYCVDQADGCPATTSGTSVSVSAEGTNYVRYYSVDNAGNSEGLHSVQVKIDKTAPSTTSNASADWKNISLTINLSAADPLSGVSATYYCVDQADGCPATTSGTSVSVGAEGTNYVRYYSVDNAGNAETVKSAAVKIDKTAPAADAGPDQLVMVYDTVYFNGSGSTDTPSGIQSYSWDFGDGSPAGSGAAPSHAYDTAQNCTVNLTVTDRAGNAGKDSMLVQVKAKPVAQIDSIMPNPATQGQAVAFNGSGIDDGWITAYNWSSSIDGFLNGSGNFTSNLLSAGSHAISLLVKDNDNFWSDPATTGLNVYEPPGWGMFRRSALHDGATSAAYLTPENPYSLLWKNDNISANVSSPAIANIDMDWTNGLEVVAGSSDGKVYAFNSSGGLLWTYAAGGAINSTPAIADLDNNPGNGLEAVAGSDNSSIFALNSTGGMLWSYPAGGAVTSSPAIEDIDNDGSLEIAAGSNDSRLYVIESNGTLKCSYQAQGAIDSSPAIGDIDAGVAGLEIAFGSDDSSVYVIDSSCNLLASFATAGAVDSSPALGDINGDGILEIVVGSDDFNIYALGYTPGPPAALAVFWSFATNGPVDSSPALATYEYGMQWIIAAGSDDTNVYALNQNGAQLAGSPFGTGAAVDSSPAIVELNSTLWGPEVVVGSDTNALLIMNFFTNPAAVSFVYMTKNPMDPSPAVGDINHDGDLEIAAASSSLYVLHQKPVFNIQPSPNPNGPYHVQPGHGTILDGSMSFDPNEAEGDFIAKHEWNLDTDPVFEKSGELVGLTWYDIIEEVCHGYCIPGMHYPVMLRVTDSFNASSEATTAIMIQ